MSGQHSGATSAGGGDPIAEVVRFISSYPGMAESMLSQHVRDESGRCFRCGFELRPQLWPCFSADVAQRARDHAENRTNGGSAENADGEDEVSS